MHLKYAISVFFFETNTFTGTLNISVSQPTGRGSFQTHIRYLANFSPVILNYVRNKFLPDRLATWICTWSTFRGSARELSSPFERELRPEGCVCCTSGNSCRDGAWCSQGSVGKWNLFIDSYGSSSLCISFISNGKNILKTHLIDKYNK